MYIQNLKDIHEGSVLNQDSPKRKLAAIMFTDVVGYTALMARSEEKAMALLERNRKILKPLILNFHGEWIKEIGDGTMSIFPSTVDAVRCAMKIQKTLKSDTELILRIGIHVGDVVISQNDAFGDDVNIASRIEAISEPRGIWISESANNSLKNKSDINTEFVGAKNLKNVPQPVKIYSINEEYTLPEAEISADKKSSLARHKKLIVYISILIVLLLTIITYGPKFLKFISSNVEYAEETKKVIAVLPFTDFNAGKADEYFSDGITEDILTELYKINGINVISRTSIMKFKDTEKSIREIGRELGADIILEGSVRREGNTVRITGQLIDAKTDQHLWAEAFDRKIEVGRIFDVQSEVAMMIAKALKLELTGVEEDKLRKKKQINPLAYDYYLQSRQTEPNSDGMNRKISLLERAIELEPDYASAYAELSLTHSLIHQHGFDRTSERLKKAKESAMTAISLEGDLSIAYIALGDYFYRSNMDYDLALVNYNKALILDPNNPVIPSLIAWVQRKQGNYAQAIKNIKTTFQSDPLSEMYAYELASTFKAIGNYDSSNDYLSRAIELNPDNTEYFVTKSNYEIDRNGDVKKAISILKSAPETSSRDRVEWELAIFDIYSGNYDSALDKLDKSGLVENLTNNDYTTKSMLKGWAYAMLSNQSQFISEFEKAEVTLKEKIIANPEDPRYHSALGRVFALLGKKEDALNEGKTAINLLPIDKDAFNGPRYLNQLAEIYVISGANDLAIETLKKLNEIPGGLRVGYLKVNPIYNSLRGNPEFKNLLDD